MSGPITRALRAHVGIARAAFGARAAFRLAAVAFLLSGAPGPALVLLALAWAAGAAAPGPCPVLDKVTGRS